MGRAIILCGFKSCGKTYFGKKLALKLGFHFIDTDELLIKNGNVRNLALFLGETKFRDLESHVIESIHLKSHAVIATGGGVVLRKCNVDYLKNLGPIVYLECDKSVIKDRMIKNDTPAFLDPTDVEGSFEKMYCERKLIYESASDYIVHLAYRSDELVLEDLKTIFENILPLNI